MKQKVINVTYRKDSQSFPKWMKYEVEILNEDGTMARLPQLIEVAKKFDLKLISIADLIAYRMKHESLIEKEIEVNFPTIWGDFKLAAYKQTTTGDEHIENNGDGWTTGIYYNS